MITFSGDETDSFAVASALDGSAPLSEAQQHDSTLDNLPSPTRSSSGVAVDPMAFPVSKFSGNPPGFQYPSGEEGTPTRVAPSLADEYEKLYENAL